MGEKQEILTSLRFGERPGTEEALRNVCEKLIGPSKKAGSDLLEITSGPAAGHVRIDPERLMVKTQCRTPERANSIMNHTDILFGSMNLAVGS